MPETKTLDVQTRYLQRGDWLHLGDSDIAVVTDAPDVKQRYAYVPVEGSDRPLRLALDVVQRVSRQVPTEEEAAEAQRARALNSIRERIHAVQEALEEAKAQLVHELFIKDPQWHGRRWEAYARLQIEAELWASVTIVAENRFIDEREATELVRDDVTQKFIERGNFTARSTSMLSNFVDSLRNDVTATWLRDLRWVL